AVFAYRDSQSAAMTRVSVLARTRSNHTQFTAGVIAIVAVTTVTTAECRTRMYDPHHAPIRITPTAANAHTNGTSGSTYLKKTVRPLPITAYCAATKEPSHTAGAATERPAGHTPQLR